MGSKIWDSCRKKLSKTTVEVIVDKPDSEHGNDDEVEDYFDSSEVFVKINPVTIGQQSTYVKQKAHQHHYPEVKIKRITEAMK
ncbi:MAG: hypothetical protein MJE68_09305 [Proteobacteria bacterium]|nr:hypothetical protein [Pseudomonadota bacterium]